MRLTKFTGADVHLKRMLSAVEKILLSLQCRALHFLGAKLYTNGVILHQKCNVLKL